MSNGHLDKHCAINHFRSAAVAGHSTAQCAFGLLYSLGFDNLIVKDSKIATDWFRKATRQNNSHPRSHWLLAQSLYQEWVSAGTRRVALDLHSQDGRDISQEQVLEEITDLLHIAIRNNIPEAMHLLAVMYEYEIISLYKATESALLAEERSTATKYYRQNMAKAADLYQQASSLDFAESNYHLGLMHAYGRGILQNFAAAMECFRRGAIQLHHAPSMRYLAILAANGNSFAYGAPQYGLAVFWFDKCRKTAGVDQLTRAMCLKERDDLLHLMFESIGEEATYELVLQESVLLSTPVR